MEFSHPFVGLWNSELAEKFMHVLLRTRFAGCLCAVNVLQLGFNPNQRLNPVTVLITVDWSVNWDSWEGTRTELHQMLSEHQMPQVVVLFENGQLCNFVNSSATAVGEVDEFVSGLVSNIRPPFDIRPGASIGGINTLLDEEQKILRACRSKFSR